ncbi:MAG: pilus assembly protein [Anaerolineales bacterium]|nr:pilus assembly protein [Anaerolineales bacterium]MDW8162280.1 pilus assembly protein [Anaerolineales bacterium]
MFAGKVLYNQSVKERQPRSHCLHNRQIHRGQGLVETAILLPMLLIVLSGLLEFGFLLNEYMTIQDAVRNAARFAADSDYTFRDNIRNCDEDQGVVTRDFYRQTACLVNRELSREAPYVGLNLANGRDDVIISVFSVEGPSGRIAARFPADVGEAGWSMAEDFTGTRNQSSSFSTAEMQAKLTGRAPNTGYVLVELFYSYEQKLKLPWITAFVPDPILLHPYAVMPNSSAEPTPTPER